MASIYSRIDKNGNKKYYGSIYLNGKRTRKYLSCSKQSAETLIKKLEYELLINIQTNDNESHETSFEKAILSFIKEVERTSVKVKQITNIKHKMYYKNKLKPHGTLVSLMLFIIRNMELYYFRDNIT